MLIFLLELVVQEKCFFCKQLSFGPEAAFLAYLPICCFLVVRTRSWAPGMMVGLSQKIEATANLVFIYLAALHVKQKLPSGCVWCHYILKVNKYQQ